MIIATRATRQCYSDMKQRCLNQKHAQFNNYGGRGINICDRWLISFDNFFSDMGNKPNLCTLDRIDNNSGYDPNNCRWATAMQQRKNQRTCNRISFNGRTMVLTDWARFLGINELTLSYRIAVAKWDVERAFTTPVRRKTPAPCRSAMDQEGGR